MKEPSVLARLGEHENWIWMLFSRIAGVIAATGGDVYVIRIPIALGTTNSSKIIPATAVILDARLDIRTPYSAGTTIEMGQGVSPALFMATTDNDPQVADLYQVMQDTQAASLGTLLVTIAGAPSVGAGFALITYWLPP
jgi:hypothetical protein